MSTRPGILANVGTGSDAVLQTTQRDYAGNLQFNQNFTDGVIAAYEKAIYFQLRPGLVFNSLFTVKGGNNTTNPGQPVIFYFWKDIKRVKKPLEQTVDPAHTGIDVETISIVPNEYGNSLAITEKLRLDTFISTFDMDLVKLMAWNMEDSLEEIAIDHMVGVNPNQWREPNPFIQAKVNIANQMPADNTNTGDDFSPGRPIVRSAKVGGKIVGAYSYGINDTSDAHKRLWEGVGHQVAQNGDSPVFVGSGTGLSDTASGTAKAWSANYDAPPTDPDDTLKTKAGLTLSSSTSAFPANYRGLGSETAGSIAENDEFSAANAHTASKGMLSTDTLGADDLRSMLSFMQKNNVNVVSGGGGAGPEGMGGWYVCIVHPDTAFDLFTEDGGDNTWLAMAIRQDKQSIHQNTMFNFAGFQMITSNRCHVFPYINPKVNTVKAAVSGVNANEPNDPVNGYTSYFLGDEGWARAIGMMPRMGQAPITDTFWRFRAITWYTYMGWDRFRKVASHMLVHATTANDTVANPTVPKPITNFG